MPEFYCPTCGAVLSAPNQPCPFCAEAQRLLRQLVEKDEVRLCARCGALLEDDTDELCPTCRKVAAIPPSFWRREDRIAGWIRDRFVEPVGEREGLVCPACQASVPPLAAFCARCGHKLAGAPEPAAPSPPPAAAPAREPAAPDPALPSVDPGSTAAEDSAPAAGGPSWWQQVLDFGRDQFRPRGPAPEGPAAPWHERFVRWLRLMFGSEAGEESSQTWMWILVGILMVGLAALAVFWAALLRTGDLVFR